jgi:hypothetical protein
MPAATTSTPTSTSIHFSTRSSLDEKGAAHRLPARRQTGRHDRRTLVDSPHVHARSVYRLAGWRSIDRGKADPACQPPPARS